MATVMPHGVLFRGGEEREARQHFIEQGLARSRHRPAQQPVLRHRHSGLHPGAQQGRAPPSASTSLFINADREYREGKAQNHLRPEDIDKIVHAYRAGQDIPAYARRVPVSEIEAEDYNCNIRRYVDNAPPPEPHDVRAHLHGGVPVSEIDALAHFWQNYAGLRESCFVPRAAADHGDPLRRLRRRPAGQARHRRPRQQRIPASPSARREFMADAAKPGGSNTCPSSKRWRRTPTTSTPQAATSTPLRATLLDSIERTFAGQHLLNRYQVRGAFANYYKLLASDFKSIAASGWGPELIPDEDILQSQFPEVLAELEQQHARLAELQALFAAAGEEDFEDSDDTGVLPADEVKALKAELKEAKGQHEARQARPRLRRLDSHCSARPKRIEAQLARHKALEDEAKTLKAAIKIHRREEGRTGRAGPAEDQQGRSAPGHRRAPGPGAVAQLPQLPARRPARLRRGD